MHPYSPHGTDREFKREPFRARLLSFPVSAHYWNQSRSVWFSDWDDMITQECYTSEAAEKCTREPVCRELHALDESDNPIPEVYRVLIETAYRRGVYQGAYHASKACYSGTNSSIVYDFVITDLMDWRLQSHNGQFNPPPTLD